MSSRLPSIGYCGALWNPDLGTYLIFEMVAHFELLTAAELVPRCRIGVAWVCWAACELLSGVIDRVVFRISSSCVSIGKD